MAGVLKPKAANILVSALRARHPKVPIHIHTHDTAGAAVASMIECAKAGADIIDVAVDSMSGMTAQPSMGAFVAALQRSELDTGIDLSDISAYSAFWELTRMFYGPFECTQTMKSGNADVYVHEIPGGQYTNLQFQAFSLGLGEKFEQIKKKYHEANLILGDLIKVTPSSKVVGDLAQFMVQNKLDEKTLLEKADELSFPNSVTEFLKGLIGQPPYGFPEPLRTKVLRGAKSMTRRPGELLPPLDMDKLEADLKKKFGNGITKYDVMSAALYPKVANDFFEFRETYGPVTKLPTTAFLDGLKDEEEIDVEIDKGKLLQIKMLGKSKVMATGDREVFFEVNGMPRSTFVRDKKATKVTGSFVTDRKFETKRTNHNYDHCGGVIEIAINPHHKRHEITFSHNSSKAIFHSPAHWLLVV
ncbi:unnamed protein product [Soboliphyme baturini]|uniref:Pyruvate carboxyltransferase domain-containing protein n=1 Tax=Soboliphyme baturini TaxID=241478 RepID=A0A183JA59_9BILA|nr:unnamed protein product [Soboliphyme baturini]